MSASSRSFEFRIHKTENSKFKRRVAASKFYGQAKGLISTGQLSTLLHLHFQPINVVVYHESRGQD